MSTPRILLLHDHRELLQRVGRICLQHRASLHLASSQSEILEILSRRTEPPDLVIGKDVVPDWFTVAATLIAARSFGLETPFILIGEASDPWTKRAVESTEGAMLIDDPSSRWLVPLLVKDFLERAKGHVKRPEPAEAASIRKTVRTMFVRHESIDTIEAVVLQHHCGNDLASYLEGGVRDILLTEIESLRATRVALS